VELLIKRGLAEFSSDVGSETAAADGLADAEIGSATQVAPYARSGTPAQLNGPPGLQLRFICAATRAVGVGVGKHRAYRSRRYSGRGSGVGLRTHDGEDPANQPAGGPSESGARVPIDPLAAADVSAERGVRGAADPTRRQSGVVHRWPSGGEPVSERSVRAVGSPNGAAPVTKR
jgi:hypothetical protein